MTRRLPLPAGRAGRCSLACVLLAAACNSPSAPSQNPKLNGVYTLQIESACTALPAEVRSRTYIATISGSTVTLSGATFWPRPNGELANRFTVSMTAGSVFFLISGPPGPQRGGVVEEVSPGVFFGFLGSANARIEPPWKPGNALAGTLSASFSHGADLTDSSRQVGCATGQNAATLRLTPGPATAPEPKRATVVSRVEITGPGSVAPDESVQYGVLAHLSDGSTRDALHLATFTASGPITVSRTGLVTGRTTRGESRLTAMVPLANAGTRIQSSKEILVIPANTFRLSGQVTSAGFANGGVKVEVIDGVGAGQTSTTDFADGRYALYGVAGQTRIRWTKDRFASAEQVLTITNHQVLDVDLAAVGPWPEFGGAYNMTITAAAPCGSQLPAPLRTRRYTAQVDQNGPFLSATLGGATFAVDAQGLGNRFQGRLDGDLVRFNFQPFDSYYYSYTFERHPDVVERVPEGFLVMSGTGTISVGSTGLRDGVLNGAMELLRELRLVSAVFLGGCYSAYGPGHRIVFERIVRP